MKHYIFFLLLLLLPLAAAAQQAGCYRRLYDKGEAEYRAERYAEAIKKWEGAKTCPDKPAKNDLDSRIQQAKEEQRKKDDKKQPKPVQQTPAKNTNTSTQTAETAKRAADKADHETWDIIKGSNDPATFRRYLDKCKSCLYAEAARKRIRELTPAPQPAAPAIEMISVPAGTFTMGCTSEQGNDCWDLERPAHRVTLSGYKIGKYPVTQKLWRDIMGTNPSAFKNCDNCPVENVSWDDVQDFLKNLNARFPGQNYRLPTEVEWEYAARGGNSSRGYKYAGSNNLDDVAWYGSNSDAKTHPVGGKKANELGLYDMNGNVWQWCSDFYGAYSSGAQTNPTGPTSGVFRVLRGGSWFDGVRLCRVSGRDFNSPGYRGSHLGFRLASSLQ